MTCLLSDKIRVDVCSQHDCIRWIFPLTYKVRHSFVDSDLPSMSSWIFYIRSSQTRRDIDRVCHNLDREKNRKFESRSLAVEFK